MGVITTLLGVVLMGLLFQKNPLLGIFIIGFFAYFKYRKSRFYYNKLIVQSGKRNARMIGAKIEKGLGDIKEEMRKFQNSPKKSEVEITELVNIPSDANIYKN